MGHYDRLSQTENDRCISLTRPSLGLPVVRGLFFLTMRLSVMFITTVCVLFLVQNDLVESMLFYVSQQCSLTHMA